MNKYKNSMKTSVYVLHVIVGCLLFGGCKKSDFTTYGHLVSESTDTSGLGVPDLNDGQLWELRLKPTVASEYDEDRIYYLIRRDDQFSIRGINVFDAVWKAIDLRTSVSGGVSVINFSDQAYIYSRVIREPSLSGKGLAVLDQLISILALMLLDPLESPEVPFVTRPFDVNFSVVSGQRDTLVLEGNGYRDHIMMIRLDPTDDRYKDVMDTDLSIVQDRLNQHFKDRRFFSIDIDGVNLDGALSIENMQLLLNAGMVTKKESEPLLLNQDRVRALALLSGVDANQQEHFLGTLLPDLPVNFIDKLSLFFSGILPLL